MAEKKNVTTVLQSSLKDTELQSVHLPPSVETSPLDVQTHPSDEETTITTVSVTEGEPLDQGVMHQPEGVPSLLTETIEIVRRVEDEPEIKQSEEHTEVHFTHEVPHEAPPVIETTFSVEKESEPATSAVDKRNPKEKIQDLLENTENLLQNDDLSVSELASPIFVSFFDNPPIQILGFDPSGIQ